LKERFLERKGQLCGEKEEPQGSKRLEEGNKTKTNEEDKKEEEDMKQIDEVKMKKPTEQQDLEKRGKIGRKNYKH
jgi:hypothetical protein